jgi:hypothetical protein
MSALDIGREEGESETNENDVWHKINTNKKR